MSCSLRFLTEGRVRLEVNDERPPADFPTIDEALEVVESLGAEVYLTIYDSKGLPIADGRI